jgi:hypothetical protein
MAMSMAQQKGTSVYAYDENNRVLWQIAGELHGYTANFVTIKRNGMLHTYNERGNITSSHGCK